MIMTNDYNVRAVERAIQILNCFAVDGKEAFSLKEISTHISLSPSTTLRLLSTLERANYVFRDSNNQKYYLGFKLAQISNLAFSNLDVCRVAHPFLEKLHASFNESTGLYLLKRDQRVCISRLEATKSLRSVVPIGSSLPLTRGASGRVLLAYLPEDRIKFLLESDPFTNMDELKLLRQKGYAISHGEREAGVASIAAPIFDCNGKAFSSLFISGPAPRFDEHLTARMIEDIIDCANSISLGMGYRPETKSTPEE